ncbi:MAG: hypothetical protein J6Y92_02070 [Lentisphaeria bacterium]|nr:hypothetical protein [Lentisphaeria bacterium]
MPQDNDQSTSTEERRPPKPWWRQSCLELLANVYRPFKVILFPLALGVWMLGLIFRFSFWFFDWLCVHPRMKLAAFPALLVIPVMFLWLMGGGINHTYIHWTYLVSPEEAAPYESPLREQVCPVLTEKYGLTECEVTYTRPGRCKLGPDRRFVGMLEDTGGAVYFKIASADHERRIEIAQDIIRMKRELSGLPKCPYVLEFERPERLLDSRTDEAKSFDDPAACAVIAGIVIPDEERGYDGRGDWHFDDFTPTPGEDEEAQQ